MTARSRAGAASALAIVAMALLAFPAAALEIPAELPDPDGKPADMRKPVKVFILMGQSNMLGFGKVDPEEKNGTLSYLIKKEGKYPHLVDDAGNWTERRDVRNVRVMNFKDYRNEWLTAKGKHIGPDLQFGYIMGHVLDEPVLILKSCIGNRSLGWDLLPPGSKQFEFQGRIYAGYKDTPSSWVEGQPKKKVNWYAGKQYDDDTASAKAVLKNLAKYCPGYKDQGYEVAGFVFWQGHKDQNAAHASRYEFNLVNFIKSLRKDFDAPEAKFAIATIAFGGNRLSGHGLTVAKAQLAVSGETGKYPEFNGNVKTVDARPFWRSSGPGGGGHHYNGNAETYMEVGNALGWAMAEMLEKTASKKPEKEAAAPKRPSRPAVDASAAQAEKLYRTARSAERTGQRSLARTFYKRIVDDFPGTPAALKAAERLKEF